MAVETGEEVWFRGLAETANQLRQGFSRAIGMSPQRVQLLIQLQHEETSHDALRRHLGVDGATVTRLVKELENDGFVTRRPDPDDNRYTLAALTPAGEEFTAQLGSRHQKYLEGLLQGVSAEDRELTLLVLAHVRNNLELEST